MEQAQAIVDAIVAALPVVLQVIGAFAVLATATKNKVDDKILQGLMNVVNFLGMNLGRAKNDPSA